MSESSLLASASRGFQGAEPLGWEFALGGVATEHSNLPRRPGASPRSTASGGELRKQTGPVPPSLGQTVSDKVALCQLDPDLQAELDSCPRLRPVCVDAQADDGHLALAFGTSKGVCFINFSDKVGPALF